MNKNLSNIFNLKKRIHNSYTKFFILIFLSLISPRLILFFNAFIFNIYSFTILTCSDFIFLKFFIYYIIVFINAIIIIVI